jgi:hypothetical protein
MTTKTLMFTLKAILSGSPATTAWCVLRLLMVEVASRYARVAANILNKQLQTADREWSSSFVVGWGANNCPL